MERLKWLALHGFYHGEDILQRRAGLNVMTGRAYEPFPASAQGFQAALGFDAHIFGSPAWQGKLIVHAAMEDDTMTEIALEGL